MKAFLLDRKGLLFVKKLDKEITPLEALAENLEIKRIDSKQDLAGLEISAELSRHIRFNLQQNKEVFAGIIADKIVHISCVKYTPVKGAMFFGDFTLPEFRGKYINPAVKGRIFNYLREKGIKKVYISCAKDNLNSRASILRAGFKQLNLWQRITVELKRYIGDHIMSGVYKKGST
jgi:RimJ/RimL family protein N-acetyltransferase